MAMRRALAGVAAAIVLSAAGCSDDGGDEPSPVVTPTTTMAVTFPSVLSLNDAVTQLAQRGIRCTRVDVERQGATGTAVDDTDRATCRRDPEMPLQLLRYKTAVQASLFRAALTALACDADPSARSLDGRPLLLAEAENLDVRAVSDASGSATDDLDVRNAETRAVAAQLGMHVHEEPYRCAG